MEEIQQHKKRKSQECNYVEEHTLLTKGTHRPSRSSGEPRGRRSHTKSAAKHLSDVRHVGPVSRWGRTLENVERPSVLVTVVQPGSYRCGGDRGESSPRRGRRVRAAVQTARADGSRRPGLGFAFCRPLVKEVSIPLSAVAAVWPSTAHTAHRVPSRTAPIGSAGFCRVPPIRRAPRPRCMGPVASIWRRGPPALCSIALLCSGRRRERTLFFTKPIGNPGLARQRFGMFRGVARSPHKCRVPPSHAVCDPSSGTNPPYTRFSALSCFSNSTSSAVA